MRKLFELILLMLVAIEGYSQCDTQKITFVDSLGNEIIYGYKNLISNGTDTIHLDQLYLEDFFTNRIGALPIGSNLNDSISADTAANSSRCCVTCKEDVFKIVDSIDINHDGVKELFLHRVWYCFAAPPNYGPYGMGGQQHTYSKYEVWDVKTKTKIFQVKNMIDIQVAVSVSVVKSCGYWFNVSIDKSGSFILTNRSGDISGNIPELGTYKYDIETNAYKKE
jgi:hypothetical protein